VFPSDGDKMCKGKDQGVGDNSDGESDDENDGDESDDDGRNEEGYAAVTEDGAGDMDQLSDELLYPLISVLICLVRVTSIAISTPVATSLPRPVATHSSVATPTLLASTPVRPSIATSSQVASTPVRPSVATPAQLATPACIALPGAVADMISAHALDPFSNDPLPVPQAPSYYGPSSTTTQPYVHFDDLLSFQDFGALVPELDGMLQAETTATFSQQWEIPTSFQWNNSGSGSAESDAFIAASLASVNGNHLTVPSGAASLADYTVHSGIGLPSLSLDRSPQSRRSLPLLPPAPSVDNGSGSPQSMSHLPLLPPVPSVGHNSPPCGMLSLPSQSAHVDSEAPDGPTLGRSRRKLIPSLRAQRDNMIGKENGSSVSSEKECNKLKGKRPASEAHHGLPKKSK